jgi:tryptophan synthase beta subunit
MPAGLDGRRNRTRLPSCFYLDAPNHSFMNPSPTATRQDIKRQQIVEALRASFRIEGIQVSAEQAQAALRKVEASLGKAPA